MGLVRILGERTYFVGVGALDDPKKAIDYCNTTAERRIAYFLHVGRGLAPAVFGNTLAKSLALWERWRR